MKNGSIVVLTGAGISAESGIRTFRASDGLWEDHRVEDVATPEGFARDPAMVQRFYNQRRSQLLSADISPNAAHLALGRLEAEYPGKVSVVTQNIDNLHERGGTKNLIHMHGELLKMYCASCGAGFEIRSDIGENQACSSCGNIGLLRPDIVWFGEMPYRMDEIEELLRECALFVSIGTSGNVYPAAGFVRSARSAGAHTIELNTERSRVGDYFEEHHTGQAGSTVPELVHRILQGLLDEFLVSG